MLSWKKRNRRQARTDEPTLLERVNWRVFGIGAESLIVSITTATAKWFKGKELALAMGMETTRAERHRGARR